MNIEELATQFVSLGAVGVIAYTLFKNTLDEKKEDRELFRKSVETFTSTSKAYAKSIASLSIRVENVENTIDRTEQKVDKIIERLD